MKTFCDTELDAPVSEAENQSSEDSQSDTLSVTETNQSNSALLETNQSEDMSYLLSAVREVQTDQSNSDTNLESELCVANDKELNLSDCDSPSDIELKDLDCISANDSELKLSDSDSYNDTELKHLHSDSTMHLESSQSEDLLNVELTRSENTAKHKESNIPKEESFRKLPEHKRKQYLKKILTSVPERGKIS